MNTQASERLEPVSVLVKGTLASVVGLATALLLLREVPLEESGRKVDVQIAPDGTAKVRHVSGKQYLRAYLDAVGVATACDGLTSVNGRRVTMKDRFTEAQCAAMLEAELVRHAVEVMKCTPGLSLSIPGRDNARGMSISLAYNIGPPRWCGSTAARHMNAGRVRAACDAFLPWNKGTFARPQPGKACTRKRDGKWLCPITGLTARRQRERAQCLKDA
ncbi:glycoside hydrolase family protein [Novosphingobium sp. 17-62-19]|uniref:glycoside hydrolase family protein n=1 Tax=Novosphingobium sp. 17-62-19 TaxID=1970406 RepID=UPI0025E8315F|nr:glycoside hydrolase family protein [Novosphingobium sp. 17-62-19]HQS95100.1 glycoside hydrolase family protein [Novosphingobium sp.]